MYFLLISDASVDLILKLQRAVLIGGRRVKEGGAYFIVKGFIHMKFQNFVLLFFQITMK